MTFCAECKTEVVRCDHIEHEQELNKLAQLESDPQYLSTELDRLLLLVDTEDEAQWDTHEYKEASMRLDRLQERHHELTRSNSCDCWLCKRKGWSMPLSAAQMPARKSTLAAFLDGDEGDKSNCHCGCYCQVCRQGGCEEQCICYNCMRFCCERDFIVPETGEIVSIKLEETEHFLTEYPNAIEVKINGDLP